MPIIIIKTSEQKRNEIEEMQKEKIERAKSRYCPECGKWQLFRYNAYDHFSHYRPVKIGYAYRCSCGCEWHYIKCRYS